MATTFSTYFLHPKNNDIMGCVLVKHLHHFIKFIIKIYSAIHLMILIMYYKY
jgi:hypothetical protein